MRSVRRGVGSGFTLIELLVVVAIMMVLMGLVMGAVAMVRQQRMKVLAAKQVHDITSACESYFMSLHQYPPDTGSVELDGSTTSFTSDDPAEADAIYSYLGRQLDESSSDKKVGSFLVINILHLRKMGGLEIMVDPWGSPYRMDCVHVTEAKGEELTGEEALYVGVTPSGKVGEKTYRDMGITKAGAPYAPIADTDPQAAEKRARQTLSVKAWSVGPDRSEGSDPFSHVEQPTDVDADNIGSWR